MWDVLHVIVLCAQDELDPLGWCVWTQSGQRAQVILKMFTMITRTKFSVCYKRNPMNKRKEADCMIVTMSVNLVLTYLF